MSDVYMVTLKVLLNFLQK